MSTQPLRARIREGAKLAIRRGLSRANLDVARDPYAHRLVRTLVARDIVNVIDVGANVGQFATQIRYAGFGGRIVSVEPLSSAYRELSRRAARDPAWETVRAAVGDQVGRLTINVSANSYSSSLLAMTQAHLVAAPGSVLVATEEVETIGIPELVARHGLNPGRTLLKVDTQGFEGHVLDSADRLLDEFAAVQLELSYVELYSGQPLHDELVARLCARGYMLWSFETGISGPDGRLLQCDGLFVKEGT